MSLESNLELNNQLLTKQNALLERLCMALASGVALKTDAVTSAHVQEYRETVTESKTALTLDDLQFSDVIALAAFYAVPQKITEEMLQRAVAYRDATGEERVVQIDALDSALQGVKRATALHNPALLDLSRHVLKFWDELPTIGQRRDFAERLLDAPAGERSAVTPKKASGKEKKERKGPFYWKKDTGEFGTVSNEDELNGVLLGPDATEINKVEFLQLKEEAEKSEKQSGAADDQPDYAAQRKEATDLIMRLAKSGYRAEAVEIMIAAGAPKDTPKLGQVPDEKLVEVIAQAEKALEG